MRSHRHFRTALGLWLVSQFSFGVGSGCGRVTHGGAEESAGTASGGERNNIGVVSAGERNNTGISGGSRVTPSSSNAGSGGVRAVPEGGTGTAGEGTSGSKPEGGSMESARGGSSGATLTGEDTCVPRGGMCLPPDVVATPTHRRANAGEGSCEGNRVCWVEVESVDPDPCLPEQQAIHDFIEDNKSCERDDDCVAKFAGCVETEDGCSGVVYLNATGASEFESLVNEYTDCDRPRRANAGTCICSREPARGVCRDGRCSRSEDCPLIEGGCSPPCNARHGAPLDPTLGCVPRASVVIQCSINAVESEDLRCVRRKSDGAVFGNASSAVLLDDAEDAWEECSAEEELLTQNECPPPG